MPLTTVPSRNACSAWLRTRNTEDYFKATGSVPLGQINNNTCYDDYERYLIPSYPKLLPRLDAAQPGFVLCFIRDDTSIERRLLK